MRLWDDQGFKNQLGICISLVRTSSHSAHQCGYFFKKSITWRSWYRRLSSLSRDFHAQIFLCTGFVVLHTDTNPCEKDPFQEGSTSSNGDSSNKGNSCFSFQSLPSNIYEVPQAGRKPWPLSPLKWLQCFKGPLGVLYYWSFFKKWMLCMPRSSHS